MKVLTEQQQNNAKFIDDMISMYDREIKKAQNAVKLFRHNQAKLREIKEQIMK